MLTAKAAVDCIASARADKDAIWSVNVDDEYHESKGLRTDRLPDWILLLAPPQAELRVAWWPVMT